MESTHDLSPIILLLPSDALIQMKRVSHQNWPCLQSWLSRMFSHTGGLTCHTLGCIWGFGIQTSKLAAPPRGHLLEDTKRGEINFLIVVMGGAIKAERVCRSVLPGVRMCSPF